MKRFARVIIVAVAFAGLALAAVPPAAAQQGVPGGGFGKELDGLNLPPALKAAVLSGDAAAISQAITTLAGGDSVQAGNLANMVVKAAEQIFAADPKGGIQLAQSAVNAVKASVVQQAAPQQTQDVITTAARLFINPIAQRLAPDETAQLAISSIQASSTTNNAMLASSTAAQAVSVAEKMLSTNAAVAVQIASSAMQSVKQETVMTTVPQQSLEVASAAARIVIRPEARAADPNAVNLISNAINVVIRNDVISKIAPDNLKIEIQKSIEVVVKNDPKPDSKNEDKNKSEDEKKPLVVEPNRKETTSPA